MSIFGSLVTSTANNVVDRPLFNRQELLANIPEPYKGWTSISIDRWEKFARINDLVWNAVTSDPPTVNPSWAGVTLFPTDEETTINLGVDVTMKFNGGFALFNEPAVPTIAFIIDQNSVSTPDNSIVFTTNFVMAFNETYANRPADEWIDTITHELGHALGIIVHAQDQNVPITETTDTVGNPAGLMNNSGSPYTLTQAAFDAITSTSNGNIPVANPTRGVHFCSRNVQGIPGVPTSLMAQFALPTGRGLRARISDLELKLMRDTGAFDEINAGNNEGSPTLGNIDDLRTYSDAQLVAHCGQDYIDFTIDYFGGRTRTFNLPNPQ